MKRIAVTLCLSALLAAVGTPAAAGCYADYKAKRGDPLELQYGVIALPDSQCDSLAKAEKAIAARIAVDGWTLLKVVSIFDASGLEDARRKQSAGEYFLRY